MPFLGQKWHFWALKLQVLKPFCIFSLNFPCEGTLGGLQHAIHRVGGIIGKNAFRRSKLLQNLEFQSPEMLHLTKKGQFLHQ